jgi:hypothetical protein
MPEYIDYRIVKPVYYDLTLDINLNVDTDFEDTVLID